MTKTTGFDKAKLQGQHVREKSLWHYLFRLLRVKFELCVAESEAISHKVLRYLDYKLNGERRINQVLIRGYKINPGGLIGSGTISGSPLSVRVTYYDLNDLDVDELLGKGAVRYNRIIRFLEEAFSQGAVLRASDISKVLGLTRSGVTKAVKYFRSEGIRVWLRGQHAGSFDGVYRDVRALELLLGGVCDIDICKRLLMSGGMVRSALAELSMVGKLCDMGFDFERVSEVSNLSLSKVEEYKVLWDVHKGDILIPDAELASPEYIAEYGEVYSSESLVSELKRDYDFTPGASRLFFKEIDGLEVELRGDSLEANQVIYYAVRDDVGVGVAIADCELVPVVLTLYTSEESEEILGDIVPSVQRPRTRILKESRINRLSIEAKTQGGLLSFEDLSYLTSLNPGSITLILKGLRSRGVEPPLRGVQKDIGRGTSHEVKAIDYYLRGYSVDLISKILHHGIDQLVFYQWRFNRVLLLFEDGYSPSMISILSGISQKKVNDLLELYEKYKDGSDFQRRLSWIRSLGKRGKKCGGYDESEG